MTDDLYFYFHLLVSKATGTLQYMLVKQLDIVFSACCVFPRNVIQNVFFEMYKKARGNTLFFIPRF